MMPQNPGGAYVEEINEDEEVPAAEPPLAPEEVLGFGLGFGRGFGLGLMV
jgi:hypothetical protein